MLPDGMWAARVDGRGQGLARVRLPVPQPGAGEVLIAVLACGVCRTDLHVVDDELPAARYPIIPGHEIVGRVVAAGDAATRELVGRRVGVTWLAATCGACSYCFDEHENLCNEALFTGYTRDGGYAEYCVADARYCCELPDVFDDVAAAPLLCAGVIGYRALRMAGTAQRLGIMGFGAAAHLLAQVAVWQGREVYAFTRPGDDTAQGFACTLGATWAGGSDQRPPCMLDAIIIFAPVGALVPAALAVLRPGGRVICGGIHMSDIPALPYALLWGERELVSVANLTRRDAREFLAMAARIPLAPRTVTYPLAAAASALADLRAGRLSGAAVLTCGPILNQSGVERTA